MKAALNAHIRRYGVPITAIIKGDETIDFESGAVQSDDTCINIPQALVEIVSFSRRAGAATRQSRSFGGHYQVADLVVFMFVEDLPVEPSRIKVFNYANDEYNVENYSIYPGNEVISFELIRGSSV